MTNQNTSNSFILYKDSLSILNKMEDKQAGQLFKVIYHYQINNKLPEDIDPVLDLLVTTFINQFKRDQEKYEERCRKNKENAKKRWDATACDGIQTNAKHAYSDSDSDSDNDSKKDSKLKNNIILPDYLNLDIWKEYLDMRKKLKAPNTETALNRILKKLEGFEKQEIGNGTLAIENSIENGWKGVFEPKQQNIIKNNSDDSFDRVLKEIQSDQLKLK